MGTGNKLLRPDRAKDDAKIGLYRLLNVPSGYKSREVDDFVDRVIEAAVEEMEKGVRGRTFLMNPRNRGPIEEVSIPVVPDDADVERMEAVSIPLPDGAEEGIKKYEDGAELVNRLLRCGYYPVSRDKGITSSDSQFYNGTWYVSRWGDTTFQKVADFFSHEGVGEMVDATIERLHHEGSDRARGRLYDESGPV